MMRKADASFLYSDRLCEIRNSEWTGGCVRIEIPQTLLIGNHQLNHWLEGLPVPEHTDPEHLRCLEPQKRDAAAVPDAAVLATRDARRFFFTTLAFMLDQMSTPLNW